MRHRVAQATVYLKFALKKRYLLKSGYDQYVHIMKVINRFGSKVLASGSTASERGSRAAHGYYYILETGVK